MIDSLTKPIPFRLLAAAFLAVVAFYLIPTTVLATKQLSVNAECGQQIEQHLLAWSKRLPQPAISDQCRGLAAR